MPEFGTQLPIIIAVDHQAGWIGPWVVWSRATASVAVSLLGHVGVLAWLGFSASVFVQQRIPVQQGQASIQLQASFASAPSAAHVETEVDLIELEDLPVPSDDAPPEPAKTALATPVAVSVQRVDTRPILADDAPEVDLPHQVPTQAERIERENQASSVAPQRPLPKSRLTRSRPTVHPTVEVVAESVDPVSSTASASSPASQASEGANSVPSVVYNPAPQYPAEALRARRTGRVLVHVSIAPNGSVSEVRVHRTSGFASLDQAALAAVRAWRFAPAEGFSSTVRRAAIPIRFVIGEQDPADR